MTGYNPFVMAGYRSNTFQDLSVKFFAYVALGLAGFALSTVQWFKLTAVLSTASVPWLRYFGGLIPTLKSWQPLRFKASLGLFLAIGAVVAFYSTSLKPFQSNPDLVTLDQRIGPVHLLKVNQNLSWFARGEGEVKGDLNRLELTGLKWQGN